jgi:ABC-type bacteriocin/lantibiotic exporter with double-glycine peptidase domain
MNNDSIVDTQDKLILPVRAIKQSYGWDCGPTALRIVLKYQFGLKFTANDMILLTGTTEGGTDEYNLIRALDILGFKYHQSNNGTYSQLKAVLQNGQLPIVHLIEQDGVGHYMVFCGYDDEEQFVYLADPAPSKGKIVKYGTSFFLGVWKIEEKETQTKWFMYVTGNVGDKFDSMLKSIKRIQKKVRNSRK